MKRLMLTVCAILFTGTAGAADTQWLCYWAAPGKGYCDSGVDFSYTYGDSQGRAAAQQRCNQATHTACVDHEEQIKGYLPAC